MVLKLELKKKMAKFIGLQIGQKFEFLVCLSFFLFLGCGGNNGFRISYILCMHILLPCEVEIEKENFGQNFEFWT